MLPLSPDGILCDTRIGCEDNVPASNRLADKNPVEGIFVIIGETGKLQDGGFIKGQRVYLVASAPPLDKFVWWLGQRQLAQLVLDDDLPRGCNAQIDLVVRIGVELPRIIG